MFCRGFDAPAEKIYVSSQFRTAPCFFEDGVAILETPDAQARIEGVGQVVVAFSFSQQIGHDQDEGYVRATVRPHGGQCHVRVRSAPLRRNALRG